MKSTHRLSNGILLVLASTAGLALAQKAPPKKPAPKAAAPAPAPTKAPVPSRWKPIGPWIGNIQALAVDPSNPQNVYAGVKDGGVFRSTDAGATWKASSDMANSDVCRIAVDPANSKHVLAGTERGLFASHDGGNAFKWQTIASGMGAVTYERANRGVAFAPSDPKVAYGTVLLRSANGGTSWTALKEEGSLNPNDVYDLAVDPKNPKVVYIGVNDGQGGVKKSTDGGMTWTPLTEGLPNGGRGFALAIDPTQPSTVYLGATGGLFVTLDGGASWDKTGAGMKSNEEVKSLALDPKKPKTLFIGTENRLYKSNDGGANVRQLKTGLPQTSFTALAVDGANGDVVYAGTGFEGLFKSTDGGATFKESGEGLGAAFVWGMAVDPSPPGALYVTNNLGLLKSDAAGKWKLLEFGEGGIPDHLVPAVDTRKPGSLYLAAYTSGLLRSTDGGKSWLKKAAKTTIAIALALDPSNPGVLYAGRGTFDSSGGVWKSTDAGATFTAPKSGLPESVVTGIAVDPKNAAAVYASTEKNGLWKSTDGGATWAEKPGPFAGKKLKSVAVDSSGRVYLATNGAGAFTSADAGGSWAAAAGLPKSVYEFAFPAARAGAAVAATEDGVFESADSGAHWSLLGGKPLHDDVRHVAFDGGAPGRLFAGTAGGSVYALELEK